MSEVSLDHYVPAATVEEDFVNLVKLELNDIKNSFFKIGFRLSEALRCKYYKKLGFDTIEECAEALFGFKKTTTYDLINVANTFGDRKAPMMIDSKYQSFNQSQLVLFSSINYYRGGFISLARPEDTIAKLTKAKKYWKDVQLGRRFLNYYSAKTIDEFIELYEAKYSPAENSLSDTCDKLSEILKKTKESENSGYLEKSTEGKIVLDVPEAQTSDVAEDVSAIEVDKADDTSRSVTEVADGIYVFTVNDFHKRLVSHCAKRLEFVNYKTIFDPDNKKMGIRIPADHVTENVFRNAGDYIKHNRTDVKNLLQKVLSDCIGQFNYEINLCGRKQNIVPFCGNVANYTVDFLLNALSGESEKEVKK